MSCILVKHLGSICFVSSNTSYCLEAWAILFQVVGMLRQGNLLTCFLYKRFIYWAFTDNLFYLDRLKAGLFLKALFNQLSN